MLKEKLKGNKLVIGSWITLAHTSVAEIMARSGFDWLAIDMEHSAITLSEAQNLIQIIDLCGVAPLVRVGKNDETLIKRVMDAGAHGVIVPMVNSREDAEKAVSSVKYPPVGTRGVGLARAQGYGLEFGKYKNWVNKKSVVIVQIEHIKAVQNLDEILECPGVDGFIIGPYDLSASLGKPGDYGDPAVVCAINEVVKRSRKHSCVAGFHVIPPDYKEIIKKAKEGYRFIGFSLDTLFLGNSCRSGMAEAGKGCARWK